MFKEENDSSFLKIQSFLKIKLGKNCIEIWPTEIVTKKGIFYFFEFVPDEMSHVF